MTESTAELFDDVAWWRAQAATDLGLRGLELTAALSPGPAFPTALVELAEHIPPGAATTVVDLGAGLCGASAWIAAATRATLICIEPADGSRRGARALFPGLDIRAGSAERSGLPDGCADVVLALGVVSLLPELDAVWQETARLLRPGGIVGAADIFLADGDICHRGPNTLRSLLRTAADAEAAGLVVDRLRRIDHVEPDAEWAAAADQLRQRVIDDHDGHPAIDAWIEDQQRLDQWMASGLVVGGWLVLRPPSPTNP